MGINRLERIVKKPVQDTPAALVKDAPPVQTPARKAAAERKRGPGRPKGAKNKRGLKRPDVQTSKRPALSKSLEKLTLYLPAELIAAWKGRAYMKHTTLSELIAEALRGL